MPMNSLTEVIHALAALPDGELSELREALNSETVSVPALLAWLKAAMDWERRRRAGASGELYAPRAIIHGEDEVESSLLVLAMLHMQWCEFDEATNFVDAAAGALCGESEMPAAEPVRMLH